MLTRAFIGFVILSVTVCAIAYWPSTPPYKINGICMVAPANPITAEQYDPVVATNAAWVAIIPYAFCRPDQPKVIFDHPRQWWGERKDGVIKSIEMAQSKGLKIMLKPHLWVITQGWAGDLDYESREDFSIWQDSYRQYLMQYAQVADSMNVELLAIGTELRKITAKDPSYWSDLISDIRKVYDGQITYCANWDNYQNITFWNELDQIGIDAYFPVHDGHTPSVEELNTSFQKITNELSAFSVSYNKPILFTEFGFRSMDYCTAGHWEHEHKELAPNLIGQKNAYQALFESFWNQDWFAGGFIWKWHYNHTMSGGAQDSHFTPQNKPAESVIRKFYKIP